MTGRARRTAAGVLALTLLAFAARAVRLGAQPLIGDDVMVAISAPNFAEDGWPEPTMWNHPRLRDLLVEGSLGALGRGPWGIKAWSVLLGTLTVPAAFAAMVLLTGSASAAWILAALLALDPLHVHFSRQGINDVYLSFFPLAALAAAWRYRTSRAAGWLVLAGALFGLGLASKWSVAFALLPAAAVLLRDALTREETAPERRAEAALVVSALALLPAAVYLLTWVPFFERGYGLLEWLRFQGAMALETRTHTGYPGTKLPGYPGEIVRAWRWFVSPCYFVTHDDADPPGVSTFMAGIANPAAWLLVLPAAAFAAWRAVGARDRAAALLLVLFGANYLPFVAVRRPIFANTALATAPFALALVAWAAARVRERRPRLVLGWLALAAAAALALWPTAAGLSDARRDPLASALLPADAFRTVHSP